MKASEIIKMHRPWIASALVVLGAALPSAATPEMGPESAEEAVDFIRMELTTGEKLNGAALEVENRNGIVILNGTARSIDQMEWAVARAQAVPHVRAVVNLITVKDTAATDRTLQAKVLETLRGTAALDASGMRVTVRDKHVTLTGRAGTWDEQELAREFASRVDGVRSIDNRLEVDFEGVRSDAAIKAQLLEMVGDDPLYEGLDIALTVSGGVVRFNGQVGSRGEFDRLVRYSYVTGVTEVDAENLTVNPDLMMEAMGDKNLSRDEALSAARDALRLDPRVEADRVRVGFEDGVFLLDGEVSDIGSRIAAESTLRGVPGIRNVSNRIVTRGGGGEVAATP